VAAANMHECTAPHAAGKRLARVNLLPGWCVCVCVCVGRWDTKTALTLRILCLYSCTPVLHLPQEPTNEHCRCSPSNTSGCRKLVSSFPPDADAESSTFIQKAEIIPRWRWGRSVARHAEANQRTWLWAEGGGLVFVDVIKNAPSGS